jgi:hypothetical protein
LKVKEAKHEMIKEDVKKGLGVKEGNKENENTENTQEMILPPINKNSFDLLMDKMLILDRSIFEYKFIFAQNLQGNQHNKQPKKDSFSNSKN